MLNASLKMVSTLITSKPCLVARYLAITDLPEQMAPVIPTIIATHLCFVLDYEIKLIILFSLKIKIRYEN